METNRAGLGRVVAATAALVDAGDEGDVQCGEWVLLRLPLGRRLGLGRSHVVVLAAGFFLLLLSSSSLTVVGVKLCIFMRMQKGICDQNLYYLGGHLRGLQGKNRACKGERGRFYTFSVGEGGL